MIEFHYEMRYFQYNNVDNTLYAEEKDLRVEGYNYPFPNKRKQFFIRNNKTGNFRRYRFLKEDELQYTFTSEDGIHCVISKTIEI